VGHGEPLNRPPGGVDDRDGVIVLRPVDSGDAVVGFQRWQSIGRSAVGDRQRGLLTRVVVSGG
jgi:hypothetical protein